MVAEAGGGVVMCYFRQVISEKRASRVDARELFSASSPVTCSFKISPLLYSNAMVFVSLNWSTDSPGRPVGPSSVAAKKIQEMNNARNCKSNGRTCTCNGSNCT